MTFNNYCNKKKNNMNEVGLNNNKIEYVQINLFNNGHEDKTKKKILYIIELKKKFLMGIQVEIIKLKIVKIEKKKSSYLIVA